MFGLIRSLLRKGQGRPLEPGPNGRILFIGPFNGGVGGVERITRCFVDWILESGYSATMVFEHSDLPVGPYTIEDSERIRTVRSSDWCDELALADYDFAYIIPAGLPAGRWLTRLEELRCPRIVLDLDPDRKYLSVTDILHCETTRENELPRPHIVAMPDPRPTIPEDTGPSAIRETPYYLTAFTPYGEIKGHLDMPAFLSTCDKRLVWCFDPVSFARRKRKYAKRIYANVATVTHPSLELVEAPSQEELYRLYRGCAGYVCFSQNESLGFSMMDAIALGKPLCARKIGVCRMVDGFVPTEDFSQPVFNECRLPATSGYGTLFSGAAGLARTFHE